MMMPFYRLHALTPRIPPVAVHLECDMLGDRALLEGADEELAELVE